MALTISDEQHHEAGLNEQDARVEIACRLFDAGKLSFPAAARWAGLSRTRFEAALLDRDIPLVRLDVQDLEQDLQTISKLGGGR